MSAVPAMTGRFAPLPLPPLTAGQRENLRALPIDIVAGLRCLRDEAPPPVPSPEAWDEIATDAITLATQGWAGTALRLGWTAHDLFGIGADGSDGFAGLAVWMAAGSIVVIDRDLAVAARSDRRSIYHRGGWGHGRDADQPPIFLWEFGR